MSILKSCTICFCFGKEGEKWLAGKPKAKSQKLIAKTVPNPTDQFLGDERVDSFMQIALSRVEWAILFRKEKQKQ